MSKKKVDPAWKVPDDLRFHTTEYVVDASHEESFQIWAKWCDQYGVKFDQDSRGYMETIGRIDGRPICVTVFWYIIEDTFRVAFVEGTSQLVDYAMIDDWKDVVFRCLNEGGYRHSDAANFGNLLSDMQRRLKRCFIRRDFNAVQKAIESVPLKEKPYEA